MSKILILNNKQCQIIEEDDKAFIRRLSNKLSYKEPGIEYSAAFQNYNWNGLTYLIDKKLILYFFLGVDIGANSEYMR
jgi:hypothetical protein